MIRIVVLTSRPFGTASKCLPQLVASDKIEIVSVLLAKGGASPNPFKARRRKFKKAMKIGILGALNGIRMRRWFQAEPAEHVQTLCDRWRIPFHQIDVLNSDRMVELLGAADADLGLSLGNGYISRRIFSLPRLGMINLHGERLPEYQNAQSVIWPIYNMERMTGFAIHEIDEGIDTGRILYQEEHPIEFHPTLEETVRASLRLTGSRVPDAVRYVCENLDELRKAARRQTNGKRYTTPNLREFLIMIRNNRKMHGS